MGLERQVEKEMETTRSTGHRTPWRFLQFSIRRTSCFPHACQCFVHCAEITLERPSKPENLEINPKVKKCCKTPRRSMTR